jgi:hypothetical protein
MAAGERGCCWRVRWKTGRSLCVVVQCQQYHHGLLYLTLSLELWRGGNVTLVECWLLTASVFVNRLFDFRGQVLDGSNAIVERA